MTQHTPGPLGIYDVTDKRTRLTTSEADIAEIVYGDVPDDEAEENALFIQRAWNSHYELLEACRMVLPFLEHCMASGAFGDDRSAHVCHSAISAAIAKATGQTVEA